MQKILLSGVCLWLLISCAQQQNAEVGSNTFLTVEQLMVEKEKYDRQVVRLKARVTRRTDFCFIHTLSGRLKGQPFFWYWGGDKEGDCQTNPKAKYGIAIVEGVYKAGVLGRTYSEYGVIDNAKVTWLEELTAEQFYAK